MALGMMGKGPKLRLSPEQRQQIRDVRAEQGRGAARAMRREMRQEAGLPVRDMRNRPAPMQGQPVQAMQDQLSGMQQQPMPMPMPGRGQMPIDPGMRITPEQMEALRQQPPMQKPTPEMMQDAMARGRDQGLTRELPGGLGGYQGLQHQPLFQDMRYRMPQQPQQPEPGYMPSLRHAYQTGRIPLDKIPAPYRLDTYLSALPQQPMGQQPYQFYGQQPNQFAQGVAAGINSGLFR